MMPLSRHQKSLININKILILRKHFNQHSEIKTNTKESTKSLVQSAKNAENRTKNSNGHRVTSEEEKKNITRPTQIESKSCCKRERRGPTRNKQHGKEEDDSGANKKKIRRKRANAYTERQ